MEKSATKMTPVSFHVLIPAAGSGSRFNSKVPKQYQKLYGKAIIRHSLEKLIHYPGLLSIKVVIDPNHSKLYEQAIASLNTPATVSIESIDGGKSRKESIINGLNSFSNISDKDIIVIHDAARPLVQESDLTKLLEKMKESEGATLATKITDTLRKAETTSNMIAGELVERDHLWAIQTPQSFHYGVISKAHEIANINQTFTDDSTVVSLLGKQVALIEGSKKNIKITTQDDMEIAKALIEQEMSIETRTGSGYDVHAFDDQGNNIKLCGVDIAFSKSLKGHSDADVALHAITDAILGALCQGDIGEHFPPSDKTWKDANSSIFIKHAIRLLEEESATLKHIDLTLICEKPKIVPYKESMKEQLSKLCNISSNRISIKATTTEGLGFIGRQEGIAAQALVTIQIPETS